MFLPFYRRDDPPDTDAFLLQKATLTGLAEEVASAMFAPTPMLSMCFQLDVDLTSAGVTRAFSPLAHWRRLTYVRCRRTHSLD